MIAAPPDLPTPDQLLESRQVWVGMATLGGRARFWPSRVWALLDAGAGKRRSLLLVGGGWDHRSKHPGPEHFFDTWADAARAAIAAPAPEADP